MVEKIIVKGARVHNLKNIDVTIPRNKLVVVTGLSGSGKSSLAFDTIYAEGQRRYIESLSSYARQFLEQLDKPDVDYIEGLSPAISIEQRKAAANPRSTVGTVTEIFDYLRLLFASIGKFFCYKCGRAITRQSSVEIINNILSLPQGLKILILAPIIEGKKGEHREVISKLQKEGFIRLRVDGSIVEISDGIKLDKFKIHTIDVVIDRLTVSVESKKRLADSVETALRFGKGSMTVSVEEKNGKFKDNIYSEAFTCKHCGLNFEKLAPRNFSFNSPYGACELCSGLGNKLEIDPELVVPDKSKPLIEAIFAWKRGGRGLILYYRRLLRQLAREYKFDPNISYKDAPKDVKNLILYGDESKGGYFEGVIKNLERRFHETESEFIKTEINRFMSENPCPKCNGMRLKPESLAVRIDGKNIMDVTALSVKATREFFDNLKLTQEEEEVSRQILKEIKLRLNFLMNVGLDYLTLDRASGTLSGGEAQRIRLATQIGAGLTGVLYVLDEPSIGLHQKDNEKLQNTFIALRDLGNTLIVVEHDEDTIRKADYVIDLGPGAGVEGGRLIAAGTPKEVEATKDSLTGQYLRGDLKIRMPKTRRKINNKKVLKIIGAEEHNLKNIDVNIPLGLFVCVTGVSGSGKSTLIEDILYKSLAKHLYNSKEKPGKFRKLEGMDLVDKVIVIDQSPIGRTPRSNPATYTGLFSPIRDLFSKLPEAKVRGYKPGRFSFNVKGGRCESCQGDGIKKIEMHFLPDVYVQCEICKGRRFNEQTLDVQFKGKSIADVLDLSIKDAIELFGSIPSIKDKLQLLIDVGLEYIKLGQSATTLSGGEAQRIKLSSELSKRATGKTIYILDEPTTGLHFADIDKLLTVLQRLVETGNTVLVIEHNLDVIKNADYIIDLGPEGGDKGGDVVANGTPEEIVKNSHSYTGEYLKSYVR